MKIHIEDIVVGAGDLAEQVVSCAGPIVGPDAQTPSSSCFVRGAGWVGPRP